MSMLAMATLSPHPAFGQQRPWEAARCADYSLRPRSESDRVALPSIRQAFPELRLQLEPQDQSTRPTLAHISTPAPALGLTSPEYVHSPNANKRRRLSAEDEQDTERARQIPRLYYSPERGSSRQISPSLPPRPATHETWAGSARTSPFLPNGAPPAPAPHEMKDRADTRSGLPSLPPPRALEQEPAPMHRGPVPAPAPADNYQSLRPPMPQAVAPAVETSTPNYREPNYAYPYHHPSRYQSLSTSSVHPFDRTPFTATGYSGGYQDFVRFGDLGPPGLSGDNKQRKRRGNLPKETTDKLRAWFVAHLQHPYPTEDEKQELMRQTGLQMNQISNWFINARRRQLPTMINNARAESDAMTGARSSGDLKVLVSTERGEFEHGKRETGPLSDGEGAAYEDLENLHQHRTTNMSRGSV
ncbi:Fc.00g076740.m01.CDS01 [Cosmosporella sp. VM-42]